MGIEPTSEAWEASILPLYDARSEYQANKRRKSPQEWLGDGHNIRLCHRGSVVMRGVPLPHSHREMGSQI